MSTRSNIGVLNTDGTVEMIYCHSDGYPSYNGRILLENYNNESKVRELVALGDISSLGANIGEKHDFDNYEIAQKNDWTRAYGRDRGEEGVEARKIHSVQAAINSMEEYLYLFDCAKAAWFYCDYGRSPLVKLTRNRCK